MDLDHLLVQKEVQFNQILSSLTKKVPTDALWKYKNL